VHTGVFLVFYMDLMTTKTDTDETKLAERSYTKRI